MLMAMCKKAFGLMIKRMVLGFIIILMGQFIRGTGKAIIRTEKALKRGQKGRSFKVHTFKVKNRVREGIFGLMGAPTKASGMTIESRVLASIGGLMAANTRARLKIAKCLGKARIRGLMAGRILARISTTKRKDTARISGQMGENLKAIGRMGSNTVRVRYQIKIA